MLRLVRLASTAAAPTPAQARPELRSILPSKRTINRLLFDENSQVTYAKMMPVLEQIYTNLSTPSKIEIPPTITSNDLMTFRSMLKSMRTQTQSINTHLAALEMELVEQSAEMGNLDAITILAYRTIQSHLKRDTVVSTQDKRDFQHANELVRQLTQMKHPLVFKMGGDLALSKSMWTQAHDYYTRFLALDKDSVDAGHVHYQLGFYFYNSPRDDVRDHDVARAHFLKCIKLSDLDLSATKAHYYLGQIYLQGGDFARAKYHWEIAASKALLESFQALGFLEMNKLGNLHLSVEWFKLGIEANKYDAVCLVGLFDCLYKMKRYDDAVKQWNNLKNLKMYFDKAGKMTVSEREKLPGCENLQEKWAMVSGIVGGGRKSEIESLRNLGYDV
ncbi:uncharacterized protein LODBEIA_P54680 [Lodderomyces beijingensis]|uniref:Protein MSS2, mitochondrial n=1 Tax=Lodderomyces beijingensis TaxID=1775926 RepID=A0ABP0ZSY7_9ASCO